MTDNKMKVGKVTIETSKATAIIISITLKFLRDFKSDRRNGSETCHEHLSQLSRDTLVHYDKEKHP